jgi:polysaccharide export outer membrane protein
MRSIKTVTFRGYAAACSRVLGMFLILASCMTAQAAEPEPYRIQPGDVLIVSVWKEQDLQSDVLVLSDGGMSFPLVGDVQAAGHTVAEVRATIIEKLLSFIPNPSVNVAVKVIGGNRIYILGKVNRPGEFTFSQPIDVMQALSLAGGATSFAALDDIQILRREQGKQTARRFRYSDVERGRSLDQNILLKSGDTVVVP